MDKQDKLPLRSSLDRRGGCRCSYILGLTFFVEGISACREDIVHVVVRGLIPGCMKKPGARDIWVSFTPVNRP